MSKLIIKSGGKIIQELSLETGRVYLIGRKQDADVVLSQGKGISREHFTVQEDNGHVQVNVLSKFGGVKFQDHEIQTHTWRHHEVLKLKGFEFVLAPHDGEPLQSAGIEVAAPTEELPEMNFLINDSEKTIVRPNVLTPQLKLIDVHGNELESYDLLGGDTWVAGRDPANSIVINDSKVSRKQFEIKKIEDRFAVIDLKSVNGTYVNGQSISTESYTYLKSQDQINVLSNHYRFELYDKKLAKSLSELKAPVVHSDVLQNISQPSHSLTLHQQHLPVYPAPYDPQYQQHASSQPHQAAPSQYNGEMPGAQNSYSGFKNRLLENKMRSGLIAFIVLLVCYYGLDSLKTPTSVVTQRQPSAQRMDPLSSLPLEKRKQIEASYRMAKTFYMNGKYELCKGELAKLSEYNMNNYLDTPDLIHLCDEGISRQDQLRRLDQDEKMKVEMEQKIQRKVAECRPLAAKSANVAELDACLQGVLDLNPDHSAIQELRAQVEQNRTQNLMNQANRVRYAELTQRLKSMFRQAQVTESKGDVLESIPLYQRVAKSDLPDVGNYKGEARRKLASIQQGISVKTKSYLSSAEKFYKSGDLKQAILNLRHLRKIDPDNAEVHERIDNYETQLTKKMKEIYEESVLEESYGNVVGGDGKDGALDKWKRIIKLDVPGNEYFEKARKKLKMYKAL